MGGGKADVPARQPRHRKYDSKGGRAARPGPRAPPPSHGAKQAARCPGARRTRAREVDTTCRPSPSRRHHPRRPAPPPPLTPSPARILSPAPSLYHAQRRNVLCRSTTGADTSVCTEPMDSASSTTRACPTPCADARRHRAKACADPSTAPVSLHAPLLWQAPILLAPPPVPILSAAPNKPLAASPWLACNGAPQRHQLRQSHHLRGPHPLRTKGLGLPHVRARGSRQDADALNNPNPGIENLGL